MNTTTAHQRYNAHVKEALLSGKPVEHSMKDFLPKKAATKQSKRTHKIKEEIQVTVEELTSHIQLMYNIWNDHQSEMANKGKYKEATKAWESKQTYEILLSKIYKREYVCNVPSYATWE